MEEKLLEDLQFQQDVVKRDVNSPLFMIREKEMEISGRVLAAKQEAERLVADARRKSAELVNRAEAEGEQAAEQHKVELAVDADAQVEALRASYGGEAGPIEDRIKQRRAKAVDAVVDMVTRI